jgi:Tol biopolymer transport system component
MGDVRLALEKFGRGPIGAETDAMTPTGDVAGGARWFWPGLATVGFLAAIAMSTLYLLQPGVAPGDPVTFEITAPDLAAPDAISPDGRHLVYATSATDREPSRLWLRTLGSVDLRPIAGTDGVYVRGSSRPVWSPDSRALVYASGGALHRVDTVTGQSADLVTGFTPRLEGPAALLPGAWSDGDVVLYGIARINFESRNGGVWRIAGAGGTPAQVTTLQPGELAHIPSGFLPDGRRFLYFALGGHDDGGGQVRVGSIDAGPDDQPTQPVVDADGPAAYANGYLLFVSRGTLMAQRFDPDRAILLDTPAAVVRGVSASVSASTNGRLVVRPAAAVACDPSELLRVDRSGREIASFGPAADYGVLNVLADGQRVAVGRQDRCDSVVHIHVLDLARGAFTRLSPGAQSDAGPAGSADHQIAYTFSPDGESRDLYVRDANGVGDPRRIATSDTMKHANDWSPDGRFLIYDDHVPGRAQDLVVVDKDGGAPRAFLATAADETYGQFSPNGQWIAYRSNESGRNEVYVRDFAPDRTPVYGSQKVQISVNGGDKPRWSPTGGEIYFLQGSKMMVVSVRPGTTWQVGAEQSLFDVRPKSYAPFDLLPDGTFIINSRLEGAGAPVPPMRVLLDWPAALGR